jgi:hypothetical protein
MSIFFFESVELSEFFCDDGRPTFRRNIVPPSPGLKFNSRGQTVRFVYVSSLRVEGKQVHILYKPDITDRGTQTASYKVLPLGNYVYSLGSVCILTCCYSYPLQFTSNGRGMHKFVPTTVRSVRKWVVYLLVRIRAQGWSARAKGSEWEMVTPVHGMSQEGKEKAVILWAMCFC